MKNLDLKRGVVNCDKRILVLKTLNGSRDHRALLFEIEEIASVLKTIPASVYIDYIKEFDGYNLKAKRVSLDDIVLYLSYDTETIEYLKVHPYFKNAKF